MMPKIELTQGDCLQKLKDMPDESVDAIVTDPPYELGFMGKKWDASGIAYNVDVWRECLRVLKPGGHLLAFGGTRTYHRMAVAIEDAGFEVRDMLEWIYACVSDDTEILTEEGFKRLHKTKQYDRIAVYDTQNNIYKWEVPERWNKYNHRNFYGFALFDCKRTASNTNRRTLGEIKTAHKNRSPSMG